MHIDIDQLTCHTADMQPIFLRHGPRAMEKALGPLGKNDKNQLDGHLLSRARSTHPLHTVKIGT